MVCPWPPCKNRKIRSTIKWYDIGPASNSFQRQANSSKAPANSAMKRTSVAKLKEGKCHRQGMFRRVRASWPTSYSSRRSTERLWIQRRRSACAARKLNYPLASPSDTCSASKRARVLRRPRLRSVSKLRRRVRMCASEMQNKLLHRPRDTILSPRRAQRSSEKNQMYNRQQRWKVLWALFPQKWAFQCRRSSPAPPTPSNNRFWVHSRAAMI